jgi:hypothetical protein
VRFLCCKVPTTEVEQNQSLDYASIAWLLLNTEIANLTTV